MEHIYKELKKYGSVKIDEALKKHTTFKIGGNARFFVSVENTDRLVELLRFLDAEGINHMAIGGGSNMLAHDSGFDGVLIHINTKQKSVEDNEIRAEAGCITVDIAQFSIQHGLTGFEWGVGVPGSIGGAVRGNAGAMGSQMQDSLKSIRAYEDGEILDMNKEACAFGYRDSIFKHSSKIVLSLTLSLKKAENKEGMKTALGHLAYRNKTQPKGFASTGCIFKNPDTETNKVLLLKHFDSQDEKVKQFLKVGKISAGWLIENAGLKGLKQGQALISPEHGNFIVNLGVASSSDVVGLIEKIKETVYTTYGILLEEEIQII
ncbi:MAG: UDP-N-acetylmuramate dehydrogenase [Candidatus Magasanikbacteria bacterium]|nr:UDP-N-acetylmuramate dehydrogenase [Candidatus Magasanikbacteria bacterium]